MDLHVNYIYPVTYIPHRCHNKRTGWLRAATDIEIMEIQDAAPAFRVASTETARIGSLPDGQARLFVSWDGRLWADTGIDGAVMEKMYRESRVHCDNELVRGTPLDPANHIHRDRYTNLQRVDSPAVLRNENGGPSRTWEDDGGARLAGRLRQRAEYLLLVRGRLFARDYEPVWMAKRGGGIVADTAPPDASDPFRSHYSDISRQAARCWRADRAGDASAAMGTAITDGNLIEVLDPAAVRYADDSRALLHLAYRAAEAVLPHLRNLPEEATTAMLGLRDALAAAGGGVGPLLPAAVAAVAGLPPAQVPAWRDGAAAATEAQRSATAKCRAAVARWSARPRDGREWVETGLPVTVTHQGGVCVREVLDADTAGMLARTTRQDISGMEADARSGAGRLLMVSAQAGSERYYGRGDPEMAPLAAVLAPADTGGPADLAIVFRDMPDVPGVPAGDGEEDGNTAAAVGAHLAAATRKTFRPLAAMAASAHLEHAVRRGGAAAGPEPEPDEERTRRFGR